MSKHIIHQGGGCQAIVRIDGNKLSDQIVDCYECPLPDEYTVMLPSGMIKRSCGAHAQYWKDRCGALIKYEPQGA